MKINRPNNWVWHQGFDGDIAHEGERGTAYTIAEDPATIDRLKRLREAVTEVTGMPTAPVKRPIGF